MCIHVQPHTTAQLSHEGGGSCRSQGKTCSEKPVAAVQPNASGPLLRRPTNHRRPHDPINCQDSSTMTESRQGLFTSTRRSPPSLDQANPAAAFGPTRQVVAKYRPGACRPGGTRTGTCRTTWRSLGALPRRRNGPIASLLVPEACPSSLGPVCFKPN